MSKLKTFLFASPWVLFLSQAAMAAEESGMASSAGDESGSAMTAIAAAIAISVAAFGGALGQGKAAVAGLEGIARNPAVFGKLIAAMIVGLALIESLVIYALLIAFQILG